ncbi:hypothetical protein PIB30_070934 [Stylosanthes scabra]|uniref:Uncharacterized protein n=1 Tax=Stylosanthes scabra TaxID=79078 RepID=A0ABU6TNS6_9FABA|nr:hypothetical protein [Stylosanthes scabra]
MVDTKLNDNVANENIPQPTPKKGIIPSAALRELLEKQTRDAEVAAEAMKRAEAMAAKQQALLEEAEKRDQELKEKLHNRLTYSNDDEVVADSRSRTMEAIGSGRKPTGEREQQTSLLTRHSLGRAPQEIQVSHGYGAI